MGGSELGIAGTGLILLDNTPPGVLPDAPDGWEHSALPRLYMRAREALDQCDRVDECAEWTRRMDAFASYYRQSQDKTLMYLAQRIRLRAIRRCGEIFLAEPSSFGPSHSIREAKREGMNGATIAAAKRLAKIPEKEFGDQIDSTPPPSITSLQAMFAPQQDRPPETYFSWTRREAELFICSARAVMEVQSPHSPSVVCLDDIWMGLRERWSHSGDGEALWSDIATLRAARDRITGIIKLHEKYERHRNEAAE